MLAKAYNSYFQKFFWPLIDLFERVICAFLTASQTWNKSCLRTSLRSLCVLVPLMGLSWILGIFYVNETSAFMQYLFALFNTLQVVLTKWTNHRLEIKISIAYYHILCYSLLVLIYYVFIFVFRAYLSSYSTAFLTNR